MECAGAQSYLQSKCFLQASPGGLQGSAGLGIQAHGQKDHGAIEVMIKEMHTTAGHLFHLSS